LRFSVAPALKNTDYSIGVTVALLGGDRKAGASRRQPSYLQSSLRERNYRSDAIIVARVVVADVGAYLNGEGAAVINRLRGR